MTIRHTIKRAEIFHFNYRLEGEVYRKSLKCDSPSLARVLVSEIIRYIKQAKAQGLKMVKSKLDEFIEMLISNKLNEVVRVGKTITEPFSDTSKSLFNQWYNIEKSRITSSYYDESCNQTNPDYKNWLSSKLETIAKSDPVHNEMRQYSADSDEIEYNEDHPFYDEFSHPTANSQRYDHLNNILNGYAQRIADANRANSPAVVRQELEDLQRQFDQTPPAQAVRDNTSEIDLNDETFESPTFLDVQEEYENWLQKSEGQSAKYVENQKSIFQDVAVAFASHKLSDISHELLQETWIKICKLPKLKQVIAQKYGFNVSASFANSEAKKQAMRSKRWDLICDVEDDKISLNISDTDMLTSSSIKKYATCIKLVFKFAKLREYIKSNPIVDYDLTLKVPKNRQAARGFMPIDKAQAIINHCTNNLDKPICWAILAVAFSGARNSEITNLHYRDIITDPLTGVVYMYIRKGKTVNAERRIPLHEKLLDLGFMDYVDSKKDSKLFRCNGDQLTNYFSFLRTEFDIPLEDHEGRKIVLYSFRHSVITMIGKNTNDEIKYKLFGHGTRNVTAGYTSLDLKECQRLVNLISY